MEPTRCPVLACGVIVDVVTTSAGDLAAHLVKGHRWVGSVALAKARELLPPREANLVVPKFEEYPGPQVPRNPDPPMLARKEAKVEKRSRVGRRKATVACTSCGHRVGTPHSKSCPSRATPNDGACGFCRMAKGGKCRRHRDRAAEVTKSSKGLTEPLPEPIKAQREVEIDSAISSRREMIRRLQAELEMLECAYALLMGAR